MTPDIEAFLREVEALSEFRTAVAHDPKVTADFEAMERGLRALYGVGADNARMIELFDAVRHAAARGMASTASPSPAAPRGRRAARPSAARGRT